MPAPATTDDLLDLIRKSGLIDPARLDAFLEEAGTHGPPPPKQLLGDLVAAGLLTQFHAEQFLLGKWRGFTIGRYKVLERLGFGGTGAVYLCEHVMVKRKVAVKVLPLAKADNPAALGRFYREARAAGVLNHPNLVRAHDIDQEGGLHFLVMDFVDGSNLQEIVSRFGRFAVARACDYVRQAALGLEHAHENGLVHRDIKPANILLDRQGVIKILDLGLARFFHDEKDPLTMKYDEKNVLGTADYVSPEQALNSHDVDIRADLYSLGCTFYFLLTGQPPFPGGKAAQKLIWHQVKQPTPVRELRGEIPEEISAIVMRMMAKKPADRYQTPAEVVADLEPWTREPLPPPPEREMPRLSPAATGNDFGSDPDPICVTPVRAARPSGLGTPAKPTLPPPDRPWVKESVGALSPSGAKRNAALAAAATPRVLATEGDTKTDRARPEAAAPPVRPSERAVKVEPPGPAPKPPPHPMKRPGLRILRFTALLVAGAIIGGCLRWLLDRANLVPPPDESAPAILTVSRSGQPNTIASVREALQKAKAGDRIVIADATWEEAIWLDPAPTVKDVVIEGNAPTGKPVVWRAPRTHPEEQPLLRLAGVGGLRFKGLTFDGQDHVKDLIALSGSCPGLVLEDTTFKGFTRSAVCLHGCTGSADQPVTLERLRAKPTRSAASAFLFEGRADEGNRHVRVLDCRLEGPYQAAVLFAGPAGEIEFRHNRVYNAVDGLLYRKATPAHPLSLTLTANTFCEIEKVGLHFETTPPLDGGRVALTSNLFARTGTLARVDDFRPEPARCAARWIWTDEAVPIREGRAEYRVFRKTFMVDGPSVSQAVLNVTGDAGFTVWVNGERVGHGDFHYLTRRVYFFDVTRYLRPGANVLAVQGLGKGSLAGILAELTYRGTGSAPVTVGTDATWKASKAGQSAWQQVAFDDRSWTTAKVVAPYGKGDAAWQNLVWDAVVLDHFQGKAQQLFPEATGNVRDWTSQEEFPMLKAAALNFDLPTDEKDDAHFLRYPKGSPLTQAGSPGVAPEN
jgi:serine/threonine protein kinase